MATRSCASPAAGWSTGRRASSSAPRATRLPPTRGPDAMFLSDFSIKRPVATIVIIIALMCLGLLALNKLRVNQIPDVEQPVLVVSIDYPGASPETAEREIVNRIEKALQSIPQVYQIRSTSSESTAQIVIIFNFKKNMSDAAD